MLVPQIVLLATAGTVVAAVLGMAGNARKPFLMQIVMLPIANIYVAGLALACSIGFRCSDALVRKLDLSGVRFVVLLWTVWSLFTLAVFVASPPSARALFKTVQFGFYGILIVLIAAMLRAHPELRVRMIRACVLASTVLAGTVYLAFHASAPMLPAWVTIGPNESSAAMLLLGVVPSLYLFCRPGEGRLLPSIGWAAALGGIVASDSRGGLLIAIFLTAVAVLFWTSGRRPLLSILLAALLSGAMYQSAGITPLVAEYIQASAVSNAERLALVEASYRLFREKPLLGWGWGSVDRLIPHAPETLAAYPHPHNTFAHFAVQLGIVGLAIFIGLLIHIFWFAGRLWSRGSHAEFLFAALLGLAVLAASIVHDLVYGANRGIIVCLMLGLTYSAGGTPDDGFQDNTSRS